MGGRARVGVVAIGRNEGERLVRCLESLTDSGCPVVYVDSGSSDGSSSRARTLGAQVVELDAARPFTAARGRNAGVAALVALHPDLEVVQVVDGDCEVQAGWIERGVGYLDAEPNVAIVCGRRRERHPEASPYNRLADMEWDTPVGEARACGGDAMFRVRAFQEVGGYDESLIAGEDPDFARRVREQGHRVMRLDHEMTLHDADMHSFSQWWKRQMRAGHAAAEALHLQRSGPESETLYRVASITAWGIGLPGISLLMAWPTGGWSLLLLLGLSLLWLRVYRKRVAGLVESPDRALYATACTLSKIAEAQGVATFIWNRFVRRRNSALMEYKRKPAST